jgi:hypothetical protein
VVLRVKGIHQLVICEYVMEIDAGDVVAQLGPAIQVVKARHPSVKHVGDVRKLELSAIPEKVDLVVGGFPCQDLSVMGKKEG